MCKKCFFKLFERKPLEKKLHGRQSWTMHYIYTRTHRSTHASGFSFRCLSLYTYMCVCACVCVLCPSSHTIVFLSALNVALLDHNRHVQIGSQPIIRVIKPFSMDRVVHFIACQPSPHIDQLKYFSFSFWNERSEIKSSCGISRKAININHVEFCVKVAWSWFLCCGDSVLTMT